jgi:DNA-binding NtrC family response regulator
MPRTILLVDDETIVLRTMRQILTLRGYRVLTAENGRRALEVFEESAEPIDLLLTDVVMPGMHGTELARRLRERAPHLPVLFTAGMPDTPDIREEIYDRGYALLAKPFRPAELTAAVEAALAPPLVRTAGC